MPPFLGPQGQAIGSAIINRLRNKRRERRASAVPSTPQPTPESLTSNPLDHPQAIGPNRPEIKPQPQTVQPTQQPTPQPAQQQVTQPTQQPTQQAVAPQQVETPQTTASELQRRLDQLRTDRGREITAVEGQGRGITLPFVQGQQAVMQSLANQEIQGLETQLTREQEREQALAEQTKPITVGKDQRLVQFNPQTGEYENVAGFGGGGGQALSGIAQGIIDGTINPKDLSPTQYGEAMDEVINSGQKPFNPALKPDATQGVVDTVAKINSLLGMDKGIKGAVGVRGINRMKLGRRGDAQVFAGEIEQLISQLSLDSLIDSKARGATFGALSDSEMRVLSAAATTLGSYMQKKDGVPTGNFQAPESAVRAELQKIRNFAKRDYEIRTGQPFPEETSPEETPIGGTTTINGEQFRRTGEDSFEPVSFNTVGGDTQSAQKVADAIMQVESGGRQVAGASGEFGAFQFMPATWETISKEMTGQVLPQTQENEYNIALAKIDQLLQRGYSPKEVALIWNTSLGGAEQPLIRQGTNKYGVNFDSLAYADKVIDQLNT